MITNQCGFISCLHREITLDNDDALSNLFNNSEKLANTILISRCTDTWVVGFQNSSLTPAFRAFQETSVTTHICQCLANNL